MTGTHTHTITYATVSRHFLRRMARKREKRLLSGEWLPMGKDTPPTHARIRDQERGPFRYRVEAAWS